MKTRTNEFVFVYEEIGAVFRNKKARRMAGKPQNLRKGIALCYRGGRALEIIHGRFFLAKNRLQHYGNQNVQGQCRQVVQFDGHSWMRCKACDAPQCEHCKRCATQQRAGYGLQNCETYSCAGPKLKMFASRLAIPVRKQPVHVARHLPRTLIILRVLLLIDAGARSSAPLYFF